MTLGTRLFGRRQNLSFRAFLAVCVGYNTLFWGPGTVLVSLDPRYTAIWTWSKLVILSISGRFCGLITHCFGVRGRFRWPVTPGTRLFRCRQNSSLRAFLAVFVRYNILFWGPGTVLMALDPRYIAIWTSSKLVVFSISGRFRGLHTVLGVRGRFRWPVAPGRRLF